MLLLLCPGSLLFKLLCSLSSSLASSYALALLSFYSSESALLGCLFPLLLLFTSLLLCSCSNRVLRISLLDERLLLEQPAVKLCEAYALWLLAKWLPALQPFSSFYALALFRSFALNSNALGIRYSSPLSFTLQ